MDAMMLALSPPPARHAFGHPNWKQEEWDRGEVTDRCCQCRGRPPIRKFRRGGRSMFCCGFHYFGCHSSAVRPSVLDLQVDVDMDVDLDLLVSATVPHPLGLGDALAVCSVVCKRESLASSDYRLHTASASFFALTKYEPGDLLPGGHRRGENLRVLQGPRTCRERIREMKAAVEQMREYRCQIVNYAADGTEYTVAIHVLPSGHDLLEYHAAMYVVKTA